MEGREHTVLSACSSFGKKELLQGTVLHAVSTISRSHAWLLHKGTAGEAATGSSDLGWICSASQEQRELRCGSCDVH